MTKTKLLETIRVLNEGKSKYQARKIAGISKQRVYQVWKIYKDTNLLPEIGKATGRPIKVVEDWEVQLVRESYKKYRVYADTLERLIKRDFEKDYESYYSKVFTANDVPSLLKRASQFYLKSTILKRKNDKSTINWNDKKNCY